MRFFPFGKQINIQSSLPPGRYPGVMFFNEVEWHFVLRRVVWEF